MLVYFDLETTGFSAKNDKIIEIFLIKEDENFNIIDTLHLYFNPEIKLPFRIIEITKITDRMLWDKNLFREKAQEIIDFIGDCTLVGHNIDKFDLPFLNTQFYQNGFKVLNNKTLDTMIMARKKDGVSSLAKGYKLIDLADKNNLNFNQSKLHGAKYDTEITRKIFHLLIR